MRQIVLDTETTGLDPGQGHRIIEIGCVELINRRLTGNHYHQYLQPEREIDSGAIEVHGISNEFLREMPRFQEVIGDFLDFVRGAELIIHNAPFDIAFLDAELKRCDVKWGCMYDHCGVIDTLGLARQLHPGQKNNLDALCKRYSVDNSLRQLHGALLDAEILADVYLAMTGGQVSLSLDALLDSRTADAAMISITQGAVQRTPLRVIRASAEELLAHQARLQALAKADTGCLWSELNAGNNDTRH